VPLSQLLHLDVAEFGQGRGQVHPMLVVGNRGLSSVAGRLLGSVPSEVSRRAKTDVLIVHTTD
jgi:hypothetical protein